MGKQSLEKGEHTRSATLGRRISQSSFLPIGQRGDTPTPSAANWDAAPKIIPLIQESTDIALLSFPKVSHHDQTWKEENTEKVTIVSSETMIFITKKI
jgi:hypothetical protein